MTALQDWPPFDTEASWWQKLKRANVHMESVETELRRYSESHPYRAVRVREPQLPSDLWYYTLEITRQPSADLALVVGDCVHNMRSALDHVIVHHVPIAKKSDANFPIRYVDPWLMNADGTYACDKTTRESFKRAVAGLPENARSYIKKLQPYNHETDPKMDPLAVIRMIDDTDKHRQVTTTLEGLRDVTTRVLVRGVDVTRDLGPGTLHTNEMVKSGSAVAMFNPNDAGLADTDVEVEVSGNAQVVVHIEESNRYFNLPETLRVLVDYVGDEVLLPLLRLISTT